MPRFNFNNFACVVMHQVTPREAAERFRDFVAHELGAAKTFVSASEIDRRVNRHLLSMRNPKGFHDIARDFLAWERETLR